MKLWTSTIGFFFSSNTSLSQALTFIHKAKPQESKNSNKNKSPSQAKPLPSQPHFFSQTKSQPISKRKPVQAKPLSNHYCHNPNTHREQPEERSKGVGEDRRSQGRLRTITSRQGQRLDDKDNEDQEAQGSITPLPASTSSRPFPETNQERLR